MKKILLIHFFFGILFYSYSQTNVYHPFPTHDAVWKEEIHSYIPQTSAMSCEHYQFEINGDTTVASQQYHKLRKRGYYWPYWYCGNPYYTPAFSDGYMGAIREDTLLKKIYFLPPGQATDTVLYDFNLHVGDTFPETYLTYPQEILTVTLADSVLIGNTYHKRFGLTGQGFGGQDTNFVYLIEGVGSTFGLINRIHPMGEVPNGSSLECFSLNGVTAYPGPGYNCSLITSVEQQTLASPSITLSHNPFNQTTQITLNQTYRNITLEVYDLQGKLMMHKEYADRDIIQLDRNGLNNGMYFLKMTLDGKMVETRKIVVGE